MGSERCRRDRATLDRLGRRGAGAAAVGAARLGESVPALLGQFLYWLIFLISVASAFERWGLRGVEFDQTGPPPEDVQLVWLEAPSNPFLTMPDVDAAVAYPAPVVVDEDDTDEADAEPGGNDLLHGGPFIGAWRRPGAGSSRPGTQSIRARRCCPDSRGP